MYIIAYIPTVEIIFVYGDEKYIELKKKKKNPRKISNTMFIISNQRIENFMFALTFLYAKPITRPLYAYRLNPLGAGPSRIS